MKSLKALGIELPTILISGSFPKDLKTPKNVVAKIDKPINIDLLKKAIKKIRLEPQ